MKDVARLANELISASKPTVKGKSLRAVRKISGKCDRLIKALKFEANRKQLDKTNAAEEFRKLGLFYGRQAALGKNFEAQIGLAATRVVFGGVHDVNEALRQLSEKFKEMARLANAKDD